MEVRTDIPVIALPTPISDLAHSKRSRRPVYSEMAIEEMEVPLTQVHHFAPTSNFSLPKGSRKRLYSQLTIEEMEIPLSHLPPLPPDSMQGAQPYGSSSEPNSDRHHRRRQYPPPTIQPLRPNASGSRGDEQGTETSAPPPSPQLLCAPTPAATEATSK
jgi:hypothetical protein